MKLTFKQAQETLPQAIAQKAIELARENRIRQIGIRHIKELYFAEDAKYFAYDSKQNEWHSIQVGGEWNGYKTNDPINKTVTVPAGAYVIEREYFLGKAFVSVLHNNGIEALPA